MNFFERENENNFSFWFPKVKNCGIPAPKTFFKGLPTHKDEPEFAARLYRAFYMENPRKDMDTVREWLNRDVIPELKEMELTGHIFVKNARFSNKFQAKGNCNLYGLDGLAQAIVNINQGAMMCEADGIDEIVVRQFIESDRRNTPCIYEGLPLRSEFRVFYDFDKDRPVFTANYWDFDYVFPHLYEATDRIIFEHEKERLEEAFRGNRERVQAVVNTAMENVSGLTGQWSVDILMDERGNLWLMYFAIAQWSAYWEQRPDKEAYPE